jgi:hypothetical protein
MRPHLPKSLNAQGDEAENHADRIGEKHHYRHVRTI